MSAAKPATPLPWETMIASGRSIWGGTVDKRVICDIADYFEIEDERQDAAYIVAAANAYPRLVAALREATDCMLNGSGSALDAGYVNAMQVLRELGEAEQ